jgi:hypothetical protein
MRNDFELYDTHISCGVRSLVGVHCSDLEAFKCVIGGSDGAFTRGDWSSFEPGYTYVFSDNFVGSGKRLATLIKRHKLGMITSSKWSRNPNSNNKIKVWTWRYNGRVPKEWKAMKYEQDNGWI